MMPEPTYVILQGNHIPRVHLALDQWVTIWPLVPSWELADHLVRWLRTHGGKSNRAAAIRLYDPKSNELWIVEAVARAREGLEAYAHLTGWESDGSPRWLVVRDEPEKLPPILPLDSVRVPHPPRPRQGRDALSRQAAAALGTPAAPGVSRPSSASPLLPLLHPRSRRLTETPRRGRTTPFLDDLLPGQERAVPGPK